MTNDHKDTPQIIVCAAIRHKETQLIICGPRHYDSTMRALMTATGGIKEHWKGNCDQGFIDQFGQFINREDAWKIAEQQNQIRCQVSSPGTLYSENLY